MRSVYAQPASDRRGAWPRKPRRNHVVKRHVTPLTIQGVDAVLQVRAPADSRGYGWELLPVPSERLGEPQIFALADQLMAAGAIAEHAGGDFASVVSRAIKHYTELEYGRSSASSFDRISAFVRRVVARESSVVNLPGKGKRQLTGFIDGLAPVQPFHDVA